MGSMQKTKGTAMPMITGVLVGAAISVMLTLAAAVLLTWLLFAGKMDEYFLGYAVLGALLIASITGALFAAIKIKRRKGAVCFITGGIYWLCLLSFTGIFFGGNFQGLGTSAIVVVVGSGTALVLGLTKHRNRKNDYKKYRAR